VTGDDRRLQRVETAAAELVHPRQQAVRFRFLRRDRGQHAAHAQRVVAELRLQPLVDALSGELPRHGVLHADETPVAMLRGPRAD
jgi:Transposase IS66 family